MLYTKDQLTNYMIQGHVHLSKKDYGFFNNIRYQIQQSKPITSNQNKLFDKLLLKYKRQLQKLGYNSFELQGLNWNHSVVQTEPQYLQAKISIINNNIIIQSPFNTQFISNFRKKAGDVFTWDKKDRAYIGEYNTYSLKIAIECVNKFYDNIKYCVQIENLLDQIQPYTNCKYWGPTLIKLNDNFYIVAANSIIMDAISNINLSDDPKILYILSQYGIHIDESVTNGNKILEIAGTYDTIIDLEYFDSFCKILNLLEVDHVFTARDVVYNKNISNEIKIKLLDHGITCSSINVTNNATGILIKNTNVINLNTKKIQKVITLTNSRPIKVT